MIIKSLFLKIRKSGLPNFFREWGADILIIITSTGPFVGIPDGQKFGANLTSLYLVTIGITGLYFTSRQRRWGIWHMISRFLVIGGGVSQSVLVFCTPPIEDHLKTVPLMLFFTGVILRARIHAQKPDFEKESAFLKNFKNLNLSATFYIANVAGSNADMEGLERLAQRVQAQRTIEPLILHIPLKKLKSSSVANPLPGESSIYTCITCGEAPDFIIIGCSLTGYDFLICGRYNDDSNENLLTTALKEKLSTINIYLRNEMNLKAIDLQQLRIDDGVFKVTLDNRSPLARQIFSEVRSYWNG